MAEESKNNPVISKKNSGFPDYLNFDALRTEGIDYIGKLSGKIWTDHNVHDPGITILEMLCYALLDLGFRTNLPEEDIFTRAPEDKSVDNNFFTSSQILACNPLTITDFRKLLVDIKDVRNAWLEVADNEIDFCRYPRQTDPVLIRRKGDCVDYLNGLYRVYIELEDESEKRYKNYPDAKKEIEDKIRKALMEHRNLCEDFIDIYFLCKQEIGVCVDIELEAGTDAENVYITIVEKLRSFFNPAPRFYTLQELLEKQKPIDEIFAGRPYNTTDSHGFVDTAEFEQLKLKKEIHLSDVYGALLEVEGVTAVRQLYLQTCKNNTLTPLKGWKYQIPENHIVEFSLACSGFQLSRNEIPVFVDFNKFDGIFAVNFTHNGKILYESPSPYLNAEIPKGIYRGDLGDYYSIQNEFPRVYGIAEGGLPESATPQRKAQAYQLKAYLLFFDQLFANYLAQLQHMRSLFALSATGDQKEDHSYFINQLTTVPDLQKLLRFNINESNKNPLGNEGSLLALPVDKKRLLKLKEQDKLKTLILEDVEPYTFATLADQDIAINLVKDALYFEQFECEYITKVDDCVFYYILTSSDEIALISKRYFKNIREATENATSVKYIGTFDENYRSLITANKVFSFTIELNLFSFSKYLQLIVEDTELFNQRRHGFLDHLLSRFAEQFTDYALLSFGFYDKQQAEAASIKSKEGFLTKYDDLSSNRGKAYDYLENGWNNINVSGFEKKFKAIGGIDNWKRHSLCNFVVAEYDPQYTVTLKIAGTEYFSTEEKFESKEEALVAAHSLFNALADKSNYTSYEVPYDKSFRLKIRYAEDRWAEYPSKFSSGEDSVAVAINITNLFREPAPGESVFESAYVYVPVLKDAAGRSIRKSIHHYNSDKEATSGTLKAVKKIDDRKLWAYEEHQPRLGNLYHDELKSGVLQFINTDAFKIDVNSTIVGKPDKFTYDLLDKGNNFKFHSVKEFDDSDKARANADELLALLTDDANYVILRDDITGRALLRIVEKDDVQAISTVENNNPKDAEILKKQILDIVRNHQYFIFIEKIPNQWKFSYQLGYEKNDVHLFQSVKEYDSPEEATEAAGIFNNAVPTIQVEEDDKELTLVPKKNTAISPVKWIPKSGNSPTRKIEESIARLLEEQKQIKRLSANPNPEAFSSSVDLDELSKQGLFVYRVVDKDRVMASYAETFPDKDSAATQIRSIAKRFKKSISYLQLCMGGNNIEERRHPVTNATWYRYQIKCLNQFYSSGDLAGKPLILFESAGRFANREEAEKSFAENYSQILRLASDQSNYGKKIGLAEIPVDAEDRQVKPESIVFIPRETLADLGGSPGAVIQKIIELILTYPIRSVIHRSKEFYRLFPCEKEETGDENTDCKKKKEKYVYYFVIESAPSAKEWQSLRFYDTPEETKKEFDFFLILLYYPGNYYVDCDGCQKESNKYKIYLREVLAESADRFVGEEQAWGDEGVQKLICVSQTKNAFHTYRRKEDCCYSFYIACGTGFVYHPCKYDTPQRRDEASLKLYQSLNEVISNKAWQTEDDKKQVVLTDGEGRPFAVMRSNTQNSCISDSISDIIEYVGSDDNYIEVDGKVILQNAQEQVLVSSTRDGITSLEWKTMLQLFMCHYPIIKVKDETGGDNNKYCIEIRLPGFNSCKEDSREEKPCGCGNEPTGDTSDCYIAWKGNCCYSTCAEAERALELTIRLLLQFEYYQPVFDCECYSHGIALQYSRNTKIINRNSHSERLELLVDNWRTSEIIAINPQCYPNKEYACEAVDRAKRLINSEGLHLVEHILLRPHCPEDCECPQYRDQCDNETDCRFVWKVPDEDPCSDQEDICFVPGVDKYSFIATVALPAWPERFRKPANRRLLENILYRETPAHILLRILWLAPHDFCCFETNFKKWNRWLAMKKTCIDEFMVCDFLDFLFNRNYECLNECKVCEPCEDAVVRHEPCFVQGSNKMEHGNFLNQVNDLYCWQEQDCEQEFGFIPCERRNEPSIDIPIPHVALPDHSPHSIDVASEKVTLHAETAEKKTVSTRSEPVKEKKDESPSSPTTKRKPQVVNGRIAKYRTTVLQVVEKSKNNPLAAKVQSFITDPQPTEDRLEKLVNEILQNKDPKIKGTKKLMKSHVNDLVQISISYYLDKICFNGKDMERMRNLKRIVEKVRKAKIKVEAIYHFWDPKEIIKYEPALDETEIDKLFDRKVK